MLGAAGALAKGMTEAPKYHNKTSEKHLKSSETDVSNMFCNYKVSRRYRERQTST